MNERLTKSFAYELSRAVPGPYSIWQIRDKSIHRFKRKLVGQAVSERSMRSFESVMSKRVDILLQYLSDLSGEAVNMTPPIQWLTFDVVSLLAFGNSLETQTDASYRSMIDALNAGSQQANMVIQFPFLGQIKLFSLLQLFARKHVLRYFGALESMIAKRAAEEKHVRDDLYSILVDETIPNQSGSSLMGSEIWAEAAFFFPAGTDTVATLICATLFYLAKSPQAYRKLSAEIRGTFSSGGEVKGGPTLADCKYLRACLDESLRMSPPGSGTLWREHDPQDESDEPIIVDGHTIPKGTQVGVSMYAMLHDESYYEDPYEFRPERWIDDGLPENEKKAMQEAFIAFSVGPRNCPGKAMAYLEAGLAVAKILWSFDFEFAPGEAGKLGGGDAHMGQGREREDEYQLYDVFSTMHNGPNLVFKPRVAL